MKLFDLTLLLQRLLLVWSKISIQLNLTGFFRDHVGQFRRILTQLILRLSGWVDSDEATRAYRIQRLL